MLKSGLQFTARTAAGVALAICLLGGLIAAQASRWNLTRIEHWILALQAQGPTGWLVFATIEAVVAATGVVPASLLGIGAGLAYGVWLGFLLSTVGTMLGGWAAFQLARSLLRPWISRSVSNHLRVAEFDRAIARDGWKFVCLMRLSPIMPFAATSYALGLTKISMRAYVLGTLASLPALFGYVVLGALAKDGMSATTTNGGPLHWAILAVGVAVTGLMTLRIGHMLVRACALPAPGLASPE